MQSTQKATTASKTTTTTTTGKGTNFPHYDYNQAEMDETQPQPKAAKTLFERFIESELRDLRSYELYRGMAGETMGVFTLVCFILGFGLYREDETPHDNVYILVGVLSVLTAVVAMQLEISGSHLNPAITVSFLLTRKCSLSKAVLFLIAENTGAVLGTVVLRALSAPSSVALISVPHPGPEITLFQAFVTENLITGFLAFTLYSMIDPKRSSNFGSFSLKLGFVVTANVAFAKDISGACMNPAFSFGPALVLGDWTHQWVYLIGPTTGACIAGLMFDTFFEVEATERFTRRFDFFRPLDHRLNDDNNNNAVADNKHDQPNNGIDTLVRHNESSANLVEMSPV